MVQQRFPPSLAALRDRRPLHSSFPIKNAPFASQLFPFQEKMPLISDFERICNDLVNQECFPCIQNVFHV